MCLPAQRNHQLEVGLGFERMYFRHMAAEFPRQTAPLPANRFYFEPGLTWTTEDGAWSRVRLSMFYILPDWRAYGNRLQGWHGITRQGNFGAEICFAMGRTGTWRGLTWRWGAELGAGGFSLLRGQIAADSPENGIYNLRIHEFGSLGAMFGLVGTLSYPVSQRLMLGLEQRIDTRLQFVEAYYQEGGINEQQEYFFHQDIYRYTTWRLQPFLGIPFPRLWLAWTL